MSQCCSTGGELIIAKEVDYHGTCHVTMAGQVTNERGNIRGKGEGWGGVLRWHYSHR